MSKQTWGEFLLHEWPSIGTTPLAHTSSTWYSYILRKNLKVLMPCRYFPASVKVTGTSYQTWLLNHNWNWLPCCLNQWKSESGSNKISSICWSCLNNYSAGPIFGCPPDGSQFFIGSGHFRQKDLCRQPTEQEGYMETRKAIENVDSKETPHMKMVVHPPWMYLYKMESICLCKMIISLPIS